MFAFQQHLNFIHWILLLAYGSISIYHIYIIVGAKFDLKSEPKSLAAPDSPTTKMKTAKIYETQILAHFAKFVPAKITNHMVAIIPSVTVLLMSVVIGS